MRNDLTVIYYTSNREKPKFESRIIRSLKHSCRGLPIISVSQKPIDLGTNICVGDVGISEINCRRQFLIGAMAAKTKYVCPAEADFLYPKEYFKFKPKSDKVVYLAEPLYVFVVQRGRAKMFYPKWRGCEGAMIVGRDYIIEKVKLMLRGKDKWSKKVVKREIPHLLHLCEQDKFILDIPIVTFKTDGNMHRLTPFVFKKRSRDLPGIGTAKDLIRKYLA